MRDQEGGEVVTADVEALFDRPHVVEARRLLGEYAFRLDGLTPQIRIRLYQPIGQSGVVFEQSHYIKTPLQPGKYVTSRPWGDDESWALTLAIKGLADHYADAIKQGHAPDDSCLVPNEAFAG